MEEKRWMSVDGDLELQQCSKRWPELPLPVESDVRSGIRDRPLMALQGHWHQEINGETMT
jgi:hypothetical protein